MKANLGHGAGKLVAEYDGVTGALLRRFVHGPGVDGEAGPWPRWGRVSPPNRVMYSGSGTTSKQYFLADIRGSIVARTDASGAALAKLAYGPWGQGSDPVNFSDPLGLLPNFICHAIHKGTETIMKCLKNADREICYEHTIM